MLKQKIERLGRKFEKAEDINLRTSLLRIMICYFLTFIFKVALRATKNGDNKLTRERIMNSANKDDKENIIEEGDNYLIVEWNMQDKEMEDKYKVNTIIVYCILYFDKNGVCNKIEVE